MADFEIEMFSKELAQHIYVKAQNAYDNQHLACLQEMKRNLEKRQREIDMFMDRLECKLLNHAENNK